MKAMRVLCLIGLVWLTLPASGWAYYNPESGRWLNRDPIGERGGLNTFAFGQNALIARYDALGLFDGCTCPFGYATMLPGKEDPSIHEKRLHIGFVQDEVTGVANAWNWIWSDIGFIVQTGGDLLGLKAKIEKELNSADCIKSITISGHGSAGDIGITDNARMYRSHLEDASSHQRQFLDYLRGRMCKSNCRVYLKTCEQAKGDEGQEMMKKLAQLLNAEVIGYDDWYSVWGWGHQYTACPDGSIKKTGGSGIPYPWKDGWKDRKKEEKTRKSKTKSESTPERRIPPTPTPMP